MTRLSGRSEESHSEMKSLDHSGRRNGHASDDVNMKVQALHSRAGSLATKFKEERGRDCIDEAIILAREALELCLFCNPMRHACLSRLAFYLSDRYDQLGETMDIEEAINLIREALALRPPGHPNRSDSLDSLAVQLGARYDKLGVMDDLNEAIRFTKEALALRPQGHPDRPYSLNRLAMLISTRYNNLGAMDDLVEAIRLNQGALALFPQGHPHRSYSLERLAADLNTRYNKLWAMDDLNEAIRLDQEALPLRPQGHLHCSYSLNNLAADLSTRYNKLGDMSDLNEAIRLDQEALLLRPQLQGHPHRAYSLNNLAVNLTARYDKLGAMDDLNEAIGLHKEALALRPQGHQDRSYSLNSLAVLLRSRYDKLRAMDDLNEAIRLDQEALLLHPQGHPHRAYSLNSIAVLFSVRYNELGVMEDLDEAICLDEEALGLCPQGHLHHSYSLNSLAADLSIRYSKLGVINDLNKAIRFNQEALTFCPQGHSYRAYFLNSLAADICTRYNTLGTMDDLNDAIRLNQEALSLFPSSHPDRSCSLKNLANCFYIRMKHLTQWDDMEEIFKLYAQLADMPQIVSFDVLSAARAWICVAEEFHHPTTVLAYETYLHLLVRHLAILPPLPQHLCLVRDRTSSLAMDAFSACLRNNSPTKAVELVEQGRGVFWGQLTRLHSSVDVVTACDSVGKTLADKFTYLTSVIRNTLHLPGTEQHDYVCRLSFELQSVVDSIHRLPGLSRFLLPYPFSDLQRAASKGPIIIVNASKYGCDALVVLPDHDPVHIHLKITIERVRALASRVHASSVRAKWMEVGKEFAGVLREIWDEVVSPIVDILRTMRPLHSRIWWCPTVEFCLLPLHAAGPFRKDQPKLADLYISSYTPSLTALIRARRQQPSNCTSERKRFVAMGQANAVGESKLVSVGAELADIRRRIGNLTTFTSIEGPDSCIPRVTEELSRNEWVHFACHGIPNREQPFESAFALHDGRFTVKDIMHCELENAEFAYLSACHTTVGDSQSPDEMIHLASAMHFAGFRSVIGTMWAVDDRQANKITSMFYDNMIDESGRLDYTRAAYALQKTVTEVKNVTLDQRILYVHMGA